MRAIIERGRAGPDERAAIVASATPIVLRGQVAHWPAVAAAGEGRLAAYLRAMDSGRPAPCAVGVPGIEGRFFYRRDMTGMNFGRRDARLSDLLDQLEAQADDPAPLAIAMQSAATALVLPDFAATNPMPLLSAAVAPRIWIGNAIRVATHYDSNDNIACVVGGRRRFTLFPPDQIANLYIGPLETTPAGTPVSMVSLESPDLDRYPRFAAALEVAQTAELGPGDAIFIPYLWWHGVRSLDPLSVLVNYWWSEMPEALSPVDALVHALATMRALPPSRRAAWRAVFDHLVFAAEEPAAHLPESVRGVLGALPPEERRALIAHLAGVFAGKS